MPVSWLLRVLALAIALPASPVVAQSDAISSGTGFFINIDGWLITNAHVLDGCSRVTVGSRGDTSEWKLDVQNDLAAVHSLGAVPKVLEIRSTPARLGEDIAALGFPLSDILSNSIKITTGNVNSLLGIGDDTRYLQMSAPVQHGNSGGPLVDRTGAVLGVNSAVLKNGAGGDADATPQNVNFSIRSSVVELFLQSRSIAYTAKSAVTPGLSTADLAEKVAPAVVPIICHGKAPEVAAVAPAPVAPSMPTAVARPDRFFLNYPGRDVIGFDYRMLSNVSQAECAFACQTDTQCRALTYNTAARACFLKNDAAVTVQNKDASGSVISDLAGTVVQTNFSMHAGKDQAGGDYLNLRNMNFVGCFVFCVKDVQCQSFAYVRKKRGCFLKNRSGGAVINAPGVDLGMK